MRTLLIYACALILFSRAQDFTKYNCQECIAKLGKQCLQNDDMTNAVCCDPTISTNMQPDACKNHTTNILCVNAASSYAVKHPYFEKFVCPASKDNCPVGSNAV